MARRQVRIWFDREGDYLEVTFDAAPGFFCATTNDQVMEKVDEQGNLLVLSVMRVSVLLASPLEVAL